MSCAWPNKKLTNKRTGVENRRAWQSWWGV